MFKILFTSFSGGLGQKLNSLQCFIWTGVTADKQEKASLIASVGYLGFGCLFDGPMSQQGQEDSDVE